MITQKDLDNWFTYHKPCEGQPEKYTAIRDAAKQFAEVICANTQPSADQTCSVRHIRDAVMTANAAIACENADQ